MRSGLALLLVLLLAPLLRAQDVIRFDPSRDLAGFDACFNSEFRDLYPVETYSALLAKEMKPSELAEVQARWKTDLAAAEAKLAALRANPADETVWLVEHRLQRSSYFSKTAWNEDRSVPGFVILVQKLSPDVPGYGAKVAAKYGPWLTKVASVFDATCTKPLGLARQKGRAISAVMVLSSEREYQAFWKVHPNHVSTARFACYDLRLGLAVTYDDPFKPAPSPLDQRAPLLNAVVRGLIDEFSSGPDGRPGALWVEEGLASYVSDHDGDSPETLDTRKLLPSRTRTMMELARDVNKGPGLFHPIENLVELKSSEDVDRIVVRLWKGMRAQSPSEQEVRGSFYGQSTLWMHFLHEAKSGAFKKQAQAYLKSAFAGDGGDEALARAFAGKELAAIDHEFLAWFVDQYRLAGPTSSGLVTSLDTLFDRHGRLREDAGSAANSSSSPKSAPVSKPGAAPAAVFSPALLAPDPADVESRHGLALLAARSGDLESAIATLEELAHADASEEARGQVERDLGRLRELAKLRDAFFENCRRSGAKWSTVLDGKKVPVAVESVEGGSVQISRGAGKPSEKIPLASIAPVDIATQSSDKSQRGDSAPWARAYACLLAEDAKWERYLKDPSPEAQTLREDARTWFPTRLKAGTAAEALTELSKKPVPATAAEGDAICGAIRALLAAHGESAVVRSKRPILRHLAEIAADKVLEKADLGALVHGKYTSSGEGRGKLVYDFQDAAQAGDFVLAKGYMKPWREAQPVAVAPEEESHWEPKGGRFVGTGGACYRLPVEFAAPMSVKYRLRVLEGAAKDESVTSFGVGICDDGKEDVILAMGFGDLLVRDARGPGGAILRMPKEFNPVLNNSYDFEVKHDGNNTTVSFAGQKGCEAPTPSLKSGSVILWFHTNLPIAFERLEIEGRVQPTIYPELKQAGIERKLAEMGFQ